MHKLLKVLPIAIAGASLLTACELPGGGTPPTNLVFENPGGDPTPFSGFPATFKGSTYIPANYNINTVISDFDDYTAEVDGPIDLIVSCEDASEGTGISIWSDDADSVNDYCDNGPFSVTVDGDVTVEVYEEYGTPGFHQYTVHADLD